MQSVFALDEWQPSNALAIKEQKVERIEHQAVGTALVHGCLQTAKRRHAISTEGAQLAVETKPVRVKRWALPSANRACMR
jgi:hypothetical protein